MLGKIEQAKDSKSGKTLGVKIGDRWYQTKNWDMRNLVGSVIEFEPTSNEFQGNTMWWINDYGVRDAGPVPDTQPPPTAAQVVAAAAPAGTFVAAANVSPPVAPSVTTAPEQAYMPMTSNVVAHAIAAGLVKSPADVLAWATAAYHAAANCHKAAAKPVATDGDEFGDEIPF